MSVSCVSPDIGLLQWLVRIHHHAIGQARKNALNYKRFKRKILRVKSELVKSTISQLARWNLSTNHVMWSCFTQAAKTKKSDGQFIQIVFLPIFCLFFLQFCSEIYPWFQSQPSVSGRVIIFCLSGSNGEVGTLVQDWQLHVLKCTYCPNKNILRALKSNNNLCSVIETMDM